MGQHVFQLNQPRELAPQSVIAPMERFTQLALREADLLSGDGLLCCVLVHIALKLPEELLRLRQQLIAANAEAGTGQSIGDAEIRRRGDHTRCCLAGDPLSLVLVQQRDCGDQGQILGMVTAIAHLVGAKRQLLDERDDDPQWLQQSLCVLLPQLYGSVGQLNR